MARITTSPSCELAPIYGVGPNLRHPNMRTKIARKLHKYCVIWTKVAQKLRALHRTKNAPKLHEKLRARYSQAKHTHTKRPTDSQPMSQPRRSNNKATLFSVNVTVNELVFPTSGLSHAALPWIKLHLPFVYRIQLSPSLGPNYVWAFHRECFSSYGFLGHMDMEIEVHELASAALCVLDGSPHGTGCTVSFGH